MPITMVSMAKDKTDKEREARPYDERPLEEVPDYPWGLSLHLSPSELRKLGLNNDGAPRDGDEVRIIATGIVTESRIESVNTINEHSATVQIQSLGLEKVTNEDPDTQRSKVLYGGKDAD